MSTSSRHLNILKNLWGNAHVYRLSIKIDMNEFSDLTWWTIVYILYKSFHPNPLTRCITTYTPHAASWAKISFFAGSVMQNLLRYKYIRILCLKLRSTLNVIYTLILISFDSYENCRSRAGVTLENQPWKFNFAYTNISLQIR